MANHIWSWDLRPRGLEASFILVQLDHLLASFIKVQLDL